MLLPYFEVDLDETAGSTTLESAPEPTDAEAWAQTQAQADGRFSVGFDATGEADPDPDRSRRQRRWGKQRMTCPMGSFMGITSSHLRRRSKSRLSRPPTRVSYGMDIIVLVGVYADNRR